MKRKSLMLVMVLGLFISTTSAFAENWIEYYHAPLICASFDADRVTVVDNKIDYFSRDTYDPPYYGKKYLFQHNQMSYRNGAWQIRVIESWFINIDGSKTITPGPFPTEWQVMDWADTPHGKALISGLLKYHKGTLYL